MSLYPFNTDRFTIDELADGLMVSCQDCNEWYLRFAIGGDPGIIGTELLMHRLRCETGFVERRLTAITDFFEVVVDIWQPRKESWPAYERRIRAAFGEALQLAGLLKPTRSIPTVQQIVTSES